MKSNRYKLNISLLSLGFLISILAMGKGNLFVSDPSQQPDTTVLQKLHKTIDLATFEKIVEEKKLTQKDLNHVFKDNGETLLMYHHRRNTKKGQEIVKYLLKEKNIDVNSPLKSGESKDYTPFVAFLSKGDIDVALRLKKNYSKVNIDPVVKDNLTLLQMTLLLGNLKVFETLMDEYESTLKSKFQEKIANNKNYKDLETWMLCLFNKEDGAGMLDYLCENQLDKIKNHSIPSHGKYKNMNLLDIAIKADNAPVIKFLLENHEPGNPKRDFKILKNRKGIVKAYDYCVEQELKTSKAIIDDILTDYDVNLVAKIETKIDDAKPSESWWPTTETIPARENAKKEVDKLMAANGIKPLTPLRTEDWETTNVIEILINKIPSLLPKIIKPKEEAQRNYITKSTNENMLMICCENRLSSLALRLLSYDDLNVNHCDYNGKSAIDIMLEKQTAPKLFQKLLNHKTTPNNKKSLKSLNQYVSQLNERKNNPELQKKLEKEIRQITKRLSLSARIGDVAEIKKIRKDYSIALDDEIWWGGGKTLLYCLLIKETRNVKTFTYLRKNNESLFSLRDKMPLEGEEKEYKTPIHFFVEKGHLNNVEYLAKLTKGEINDVIETQESDGNNVKRTILSIAITKKPTQIGNILFKHSYFDRTQKEQTICALLKVPNITAAWKSKLEAKKKELEKKILECCLDGDIEKLEMLCEECPELRKKIKNVNVPDWKGYKMMHMACKKKDIPTLKWLLDREGIDINEEAIIGGKTMTPAKLLCGGKYNLDQRKSIQILKMLEEKSKTPWEKDKLNKLFDAALEAQNIEIAKYLFKKVEAVLEKQDDKMKLLKKVLERGNKAICIYAISNVDLDVLQGNLKELFKTALAYKRYEVIEDLWEICDYHQSSEIKALFEQTLKNKKSATGREKILIDLLRRIKKKKKDSAFRKLFIKDDGDISTITVVGTIIGGALVSRMLFLARLKWLKHKRGSTRAPSTEKSIEVSGPKEIRKNHKRWFEKSK